MNDRFKLRVWDKGAKCMVYLADPVLQIFKNQFNGDFGIWYEWQGTTLYSRHTHDIFMQCTGWKDIDGKLGYENDIVEYHEHTPSGDIKENGIIKYDEEKAVWSLIDKNGKLIDELNHFTDLKIIGNKYENFDYMQ